MERSHGFAFLRLHIAVFLFGAAGLFGKLVSLPAMDIVLGRVGFAALALAGFMVMRRLSFKINGRKDVGALVVLGALLALHWWTFFMSIQVSSVAIAVLTFTSFPIFTLILDRVFFNTELDHRHFLSIVMCSAGLLIMLPALSLAEANSQGVLWGCLAGFSFAVLSMMNRRYTNSYHAVSLTFYQCFFATCWITLCAFAGLFSVSLSISTYDLGLLALLGAIFTALAHGLFISSLEKAGLKTASITTMLEPVYGIALAWLLLGSILEIKTAIGAVFILGAVALIYMPRRSALLDDT